MLVRYLLFVLKEKRTLRHEVQNMYVNSSLSIQTDSRNKHKCRAAEAKSTFKAILTVFNLSVAYRVHTMPTIQVKVNEIRFL